MIRRAVVAAVMAGAAVVALATPVMAGEPNAPAPTASAAVPASSSQAVAVARGYLGVPYRWGGASNAGLDCSGLVYVSLRRLGLTPPRTAAAQQRWATAIPAGQRRPGDLIFYGRPAHHVAIYVGNGLMIEAPKSGLSVRIRDVYSGATYGRPR